MGAHTLHIFSRQFKSNPITDTHTPTPYSMNKSKLRVVYPAPDHAHIHMMLYEPVEMKQKISAHIFTFHEWLCVKFYTNTSGKHIRRRTIPYYHAYEMHQHNQPTGHIFTRILWMFLLVALALFDCWSLLLLPAAFAAAAIFCCLLQLGSMRVSNTQTQDVSLN